ncbi:MAG: radical SAM protein [Methanomassiliicoccaceae archaeon]|nr:radical SAM protein [Methanomassiliicoccaceae archaeon]
MSSISIIVKPTVSCNIDCKHCYHTVSERSSSDVISKETLENVIRMASEEYETVWFIWHGGEPLTPPLRFYKDAVGLQEKYFGKGSHRVSNTIQTNGTLMEKKFMNFCREKKINVGVSFEGPCNDVLRERTDEVQKNIEMMKKEGHMFSVSSTICKAVTKDMEKIYDHFIEKDIALSFSPVIPLGCADADMIPDALEYSKKSIELFDKWLFDVNATVPLMPHLQYVMSALGEPSVSDCSHSSCLMKWISVYPNGDLYPCAKGCPSSLKLCNVSEIEKLSDAFLTDARNEMLSKTVERREKCASSCPLYRYCTGGCSVDALSEGSMSDNGFSSCVIFKNVFPHISKTIGTILKERPDLSRYNKFIRDAIVGKLVNPMTVGL